MKLNGKKVVYEHKGRKLLHILTQKKKIVTYTFTQFFKWNHDYSFLSTYYILEEKKLKQKKKIVFQMDDE